MAFAWDDVAVFLAVLRERTTGRAAASLGCSQPTVVRRIAAFEDAIGMPLFLRTATGFEPTVAAAALRPGAETMERAACTLEAEAAALRGEGTSTIRLTLLDHFEPIFIPILREFQAAWPGIAVDLLASDRIFDLGRGEADIAVRGGCAHAGDAVLVRALPRCGWAVYGPADGSPPLPREWAACCGHPLAVIEGPAQHLPVYRHLLALAGEGPILRCSNYNALRSVVGAGGAISALPVTVGDNAPELVRAFGPDPEYSAAIFLVGRRVALRRPEVRALFETISDYFRRRPEVLTGEQAA